MMASTSPKAMELRKFIIHRMMSHQNPGSGSAWDRERDRQMGQDRLSEWEWLEGLIHHVPHVIVGGMAVNQFAPPRATEDIGIAVAVHDMKDILRVLHDAGFEQVSELSIGGYSLKRGHATLDVLLLEEEWVNQALAKPHHVGPFPVIDLPYLILLKMAASRGTDIGDIQRMLHGANEAERARVRDIFAKYAPQDVEDLEQLISLSDHAW